MSSPLTLLLLFCGMPSAIRGAGEGRRERLPPAAPASSPLSLPLAFIAFAFAAGACSVQRLRYKLFTSVDASPTPCFVFGRFITFYFTGGAGFPAAGAGAGAASPASALGRERRSRDGEGDGDFLGDGVGECAGVTASPSTVTASFYVDNWYFGFICGYALHSAGSFAPAQRYLSPLIFFSNFESC